MFELIKDQLRYILHYADKIRANFYHILSSHSPFVFLSKEQFDETKTPSRDNTMSILQGSLEIQVSTLVTNIAYEIFLTIPIDFDKTKAKIFQIIPFPIYKGNSSYLPILSHEFFTASAKTGGEFTTIKSNENVKVSHSVN